MKLQFWGENLERKKYFIEIETKFIATFSFAAQNLMT